MKYNELVKCGPGSVISELELSTTNLYLEMPCDGPYHSTFHWWLYKATIDGEIVPLEIPELNKEFRIENGQLIYVKYKINQELIFIGKLILNSSGIIINPERCVGDSYQDRFVYSSSIPFDCSGNNYPDKIMAITSKTFITGKCSSNCSDVKAGFQVVGPGIM